MKEFRNDNCLLFNEQSTSCSTFKAFRVFCILSLKYSLTSFILFLFFSFLVTNISFVSRSGEGATRELASSRPRAASRSDETFAKWWKNFEMITAYFVMNKALHAAHLKYFEFSAFWVLNIFSHFSFFFSFLFFSSLVCRLSMTRHLLNSFIELIVT